MCPCTRMESIAQLTSQMSRPRVKDVGRTDYGELFGLPVRPQSRHTSVFIQGSWTICALRWLCRRGASSLCGIHQPWEQYSGPVSDSISKCLKDKAEALHPVSLFVEAVIYGVLLKLEARWIVGLPKGTFVHLRISEEHPGRKLSGRGTARGGLVIVGTALWWSV